jgi:hypothetical protein
MQVRSVLMVHRKMTVGRPGAPIGYVCRLSAGPDQSLVALGCDLLTAFYCTFPLTFSYSLTQLLQILNHPTSISSSH